MATIQYTSRLTSTAADGVLVESKYIKDETQGKLQSEINADIYKRLDKLKPGTSGLIYTLKGIKDKYTDLPGDPDLGDVWTVKEAYGDYPENTNFAWTSEGWVSLGGIIDNSELHDFKTETAGRLKEITNRLDIIEGDQKGSIENALEEAKFYTDQQLGNTVSWIEDEDLLSGNE